MYGVVLSLIKTNITTVRLYRLSLYNIGAPPPFDNLTIMVCVYGVVRSLIETNITTIRLYWLSLYIGVPSPFDNLTIMPCVYGIVQSLIETNITTIKLYWPSLCSVQVVGARHSYSGIWARGDICCKGNKINDSRPILYSQVILMACCPPAPTNNCILFLLF